MKTTIAVLHSSHKKKKFNCGKELLDNYLHKQASQDVKRKFSVVHNGIAPIEFPVSANINDSAKKAPSKNIVAGFSRTMIPSTAAT